jgi:hypothetical protein
MQYLLPHHDATYITDLELSSDVGSITFSELEKWLHGDYTVQVAMIRELTELSKKYRCFGLSAPTRVA